jgi:hypothetical protein
MKIFTAWLLLLTLCGCTVSFTPDSQAELPEPTAGTAAEQTAATDAALEYLALIDSKAYEATWEHAGSALRTTTNKFLWTNVLRTAGRALGTPPKREIEGFGFTPQIDANVPVGEYVLFQFKSKSAAVTWTEKVVMQKEQGTWKIVGYFVTKRAEFGTGT